MNIRSERTRLPIASRLFAVQCLHNREETRGVVLLLDYSIQRTVRILRALLFGKLAGMHDDTPVVAATVQDVQDVQGRAGRDFVIRDHDIYLGVATGGEPKRRIEVLGTTHVVACGRENFVQCVAHERVGIDAEEMKGFRGSRGHDENELHRDAHSWRTAGT